MTSIKNKMKQVASITYSFKDEGNNTITYTFKSKIVKFKDFFGHLAKQEIEQLK